MLKAGDIVEVKNWGGRYPTNTPWFLENKKNLKVEWLINYAYEADNFRDPKVENKYVVLYADSPFILITKYRKYNYNNPYSGCFDTPVYLFEESALRKLDETETVTMTLQEIEQKLGYKIRLVASKE